MPRRRALAVAIALPAAGLAALAVRYVAPGAAAHGPGAVPAGLRERLAHAAPVQALRCGFAPAPRLAGQAAVITYRHVGDEDPAGDRFITLTSAGTLTVGLRAGGVVTYAVGAAAAQALFATVDAEHLLCVATVPRYGARAAALYRDTLEVGRGGERRVLSLDRCHGVSDPLAFAAVSAALQALVPDGPPPDPLLPGRPGAGGMVSGACDDGLLAALEARASAWR